MTVNFSAVLAMGLSIFATSSLAQNIQLPGAQAMTQAQGAMVGGAGLGAMSTGGVPSIRSIDPVLPVAPSFVGGQPGLNPSSAFGPPVEPLKPNDFQKYVLETTGFKLPLYGQAFFENIQNGQRLGVNPFAPIDGAPVTSDYPLGPGDQLVIRGWGSLLSLIHI